MNTKLPPAVIVVVMVVVLAIVGYFGYKAMFPPKVLLAPGTKLTPPAPPAR